VTVAKDAYLVLLRGVNVGGKNRVPMAALRERLEADGFSDVSTYIASGNILLTSDRRPPEIKAHIERMLPEAFDLHDDLVKVLVLSRDQVEAIVANKPKGFGDEPGTYHSDAIFLIDIDADEAMKAFDPREGVDRVWRGDGVIYSQRVSALRTQSRLNRIIGTPAYRSMTIRSWQTTLALRGLMR
jgi:uncharacterized protein (DUF1697 family)